MYWLFSLSLVFWDSALWSVQTADQALDADGHYNGRDSNRSGILWLGFVQLILFECAGLAGVGCQTEGIKLLWQQLWAQMEVWKPRRPRQQPWPRSRNPLRVWKARVSRPEPESRTLQVPNDCRSRRTSNKGFGPTHSLSVVSVKAAQEAVEQVADSSKETVGIGNVSSLMSVNLHNVMVEVLFLTETPSGQEADPQRLKIIISFLKVDLNIEG